MIRTRDSISNTNYHTYGGYWAILWGRGVARTFCPGAKYTTYFSPWLQYEATAIKEGMHYLWTFSEDLWKSHTSLWSSLRGQTPGPLWPATPLIQAQVSVPKQYNLVPDRWRWCSVAGIVPASLPLHRPCVTNSVVHQPRGSMATHRKSSTLTVIPRSLPFFKVHRNRPQNLQKKLQTNNNNSRSSGNSNSSSSTSSSSSSSSNNNSN